MSSRPVFRVVLVALMFLAASCASGDEKVESTSPGSYVFSFEHVWRNCKEVLAVDYRLALEDTLKRQLTTDWVEQLHPMAGFGMRHRLIVTVEGDDVAGWTVKSAEEAEKNTEDKYPLSAEDADWEETTPEGARAERFQWNLFRRLRPSETWRSDVR